MLAESGGVLVRRGERDVRPTCDSMREYVDSTHLDAGPQNGPWLSRHLLQTSRRLGKRYSEELLTGGIQIPASDCSVEEGLSEQNSRRSIILEIKDLY
jgi:hypothetical protein